MKDEIKFKEYLATLCEIHDRTMSKMLTDLYWKVLEPFNNEDCENAFREIIYTGRFFPKPADFTELLHGNKKNQATLAWLQVLETVKRVGDYRSVKFSNPVIHSVIESMGGWVRLAGDMQAAEEKWKQKEFERLYEVISQNPRGKHPEYLAGKCEIANGANGYAVKPDIIMIGFDRLRLVG